MNTIPIQMVDLRHQYLRLKPEIDAAIQEVLTDCRFINGTTVGKFAGHLAQFLGASHVIPCGNGTDALQIAMMALHLQPGDEVLVPAFNYVASAEAAALLGLIPVFVDVDEQTFNLNPAQLEEAITPRTKAVIAVHLFGQSCDMETITAIAKKHSLFIIEDNAQSVGATFRFSDGTVRYTGTIGIIGTTSFFPSKPLACFGDGGAIITSDEALGKRLRMLCNHGQETKYRHQTIGCNSRLDTLHAAVLDVKLKYLEAFNKKRIDIARRYDAELQNDGRWIIPSRHPNASHIYHQYTLRIMDGFRDKLQEHLKKRGIPSMVYYPLPLDKQEAFSGYARKAGSLDTSLRLTQEVLSIPIHTEMTESEQEYIIKSIKEL